MTYSTRTINPLPFEHLEPHRFEDMVRQLAYDFRIWQEIEATGRSGNDDGFDARFRELPPQNENLLVEDNEDDGQVDIQRYKEGRIWLLQCKREKIITLKKILNYLDNISEDERKSIYGILFVAACDFSKKTRDLFRQHCNQLGFQEFQMWGKSELEDKLFMPQNDIANHI